VGGMWRSAREPRGGLPESHTLTAVLGTASRARSWRTSSALRCCSAALSSESRNAISVRSCARNSAAPRRSCCSRSCRVESAGFGVWGLGLGAWVLGFGFWGLGLGFGWGLGFGVWGLKFWVKGLGFGVWGIGIRVYGLGFRVHGLGFRIWNMGCGV